MITSDGNVSCFFKLLPLLLLRLLLLLLLLLLQCFATSPIHKAVATHWNMWHFSTNKRTNTLAHTAARPSYTYIRVRICDGKVVCAYHILFLLRTYDAHKTAHSRFALALARVTNFWENALWLGKEQELVSRLCKLINSKWIANVILRMRVRVRVYGKVLLLWQTIRWHKFHTHTDTPSTILMFVMRSFW